jgi:hypothetical protein
MSKSIKKIYEDMYFESERGGCLVIVIKKI